MLKVDKRERSIRGKERMFRFKIGGELPTEDDEVAHSFRHCNEYVEMNFAPSVGRRSAA